MLGIEDEEDESVASDGSSSSEREKWRGPTEMVTLVVVLLQVEVRMGVLCARK